MAVSFTEFRAFSSPGLLGLSFFSSLLIKFGSLMFVCNNLVIIPVGFVTGGFAGALAGKFSDTGALRGGGLGAIAGAILALEIFEASRAFFSLDNNPANSRASFTMASFTEEVLRGRFFDGQFSQAMPTNNNHWQWQVNPANISYDNIREAYERAASRGLSSDALKRLPCHEISEETKADQSICCSICLQDLETGDIARRLPQCRHTFHLKCVDQWLVRHGSCPVCRQDVRTKHIKTFAFWSKDNSR